MDTRHTILREEEEEVQHPPAQHRGILAPLQRLLQKRNFQMALLVLVLIVALLVLCGSVVVVVLRMALGPAGGKCRPPPPFVAPYDHSLPEVRADRPVLIRNAQILDQERWLQRAHILMDRTGRIRQVESDLGMLNKTLRNDPDLEEYDANGRFVTAGLVDLHSHLGLDKFPTDLRGSLDVNERVAPITPMVRAVDALDPQDPAIRQMIGLGGITTSLVLPGSSNVMGGEGVIVKSRLGQTTNGMVVKYSPRTLKMACGENPKKVYGGRQQMPYTRMGAAWLMRKTFDAAQRLMREQDEWDCDSQNLDKPVHMRPYDMELDPIVGLLRGHNISLNIHCYEVEDLEMAIRISDEFDFKIDTFHHALEAHIISEQLATRNISVATFADHWGTKVESFDTSVRAPITMANAGVNVIIKSDHPVTHAKNLMQNAAIAHFYGLNNTIAIQSVTTNPAKGMHLEDRIGRVLPGYDGDLIVWDRYPLALGAQPVRVYVDSKLEINNAHLPARSNEVQERGPDPELLITGDGNKQCGVKVTQTVAIVIDGVHHIYIMDDNDTVESGRVVIKDGIVTCVGENCEIPDQAIVYKLQGNNNHVVPGFIEASTDLGLMEIAQEAAVNDGNTYGMVSYRSAQYGIRMSSDTMTAAWRGGVTTVVTHPTGDALIDGFGVAYSTSGSFISDAIVRNQTSLEWKIGTDIKKSNKPTSSVSGQIQELRNRLDKAKKAMDSDKANENDVFVRLLGRTFPVAVRVNQADDIGQVLDMQKEYDFELVIIGGAESHLLKDRIAAQGVSVILLPIGIQQGKDWDTRRADNIFNAGDLVEAGVRVGVGVSRLFNARNIRWSAGIISQEGRGQLSFQQALSSVTRDVADMFHLSGHGRIQVGDVANLVLLDGNPLTFLGKTRLVVSGRHVECNPEQV